MSYEDDQDLIGDLARENSALKRRTEDLRDALLRVRAIANSKAGARALVEIERVVDKALGKGSG